jgi:imidazolonepropionase-like amidohydrolase
MKKIIPLLFLLFSTTVFAQATPTFTLFKPDRVFDGQSMHTNWVVLVKNNRIEMAGTLPSNLPPNTTVVELKGMTLLPGLIEGHSHLLLHPYNEVSWDDQVLKETRSERILRAGNHAKATIMAGFTTVRDLGTEGAMYDDVGLKKAIEKGIILGPRMIIATRALVAKGAYGPKSNNPDVDFPQGAAEVGGPEQISTEVRTQIGNGADVIKVYADYRAGRDGESVAIFSTEELRIMANIANSGNRQLVAHASTPEGMMRAILGGASTIEHGDQGTADVFKLMKEKNVALCPTLSAGDAVEQYRGWKKGVDAEPARIINKKKTFQLALQEGVTMCMGGDVGVYTHGDNAREMEMMVNFGMSPIAVLQSATSVNAKAFSYADKIGSIKATLLADLIAVEGDPSANIHDIRRIKMVMKDGKFILQTSTSTNTTSN